VATGWRLLPTVDEIEISENGLLAILKKSPIFQKMPVYQQAKARLRD
jgi:hypothetical protein